MAGGWKISMGVGGGFTGVGVLVGITALVTRIPEVAYGMIGPSIAGLTNLAVGAGLRRQAKRMGTPVVLSDPARNLLRALVARAQVWQGGWRPRGTTMHGPHAWPGYKPPVAPPAVALDALERAATAHNRVVDALGETKDERARRLLSAADAGMGEALHQAATFREDAAPLESTVARLTELADLVERSVEQPESPSALRSNLESTLEELRAENEARQELWG